MLKSQPSPSWCPPHFINSSARIHTGDLVATYAVGDIQGCLLHLKRLIDKVRFSDSDTLWLAGDLVNRGPESLETLRFIKSLGERAIIVLGNHDLHLLACWYSVRKPNKKDTFDEILNASDAAELMHWLIQQPLMHRDTRLGYTMVHAGIPPHWSIDFAQARAREVESTLRSSNPRTFLENMYGNEPDRWQNTLHGSTRLRVITNYFTRMRFCGKDGELEFNSKGLPNDPPLGFLPWYSYPNHRCKDQRILFGHWAALQGKTKKTNFIGLDTGCVWGNELTMLHLEEGLYHCIDCKL